MVKPLDIASVGLCAVAALSALLALALPYWQTQSGIFLGVSVQSNFGLWRFCANVDGKADVCGNAQDIVDNDEVKSALYATRAMVILGLLCTCASLIPLIALFFCLDGHQIKRLTAMGLSATGGLFLMIGMAVFDDKVADDEASLSAGFVLDILGWLFSWAAAGVLILAYRTTGGDD